MIPKLALLLALAVAGTATSMTTAANALDKPTFGEKFMMPLYRYRSVNSGKGTDIRPWTTTHGSKRSPGTQKNSDAKLNAIRNVRQ